MTAADQAAGAGADVLPLPGLPEVANRPVGSLEREARAHVSALIDADRLKPGHRLLVAMILQTARSADLSVGKIAGVQAAKLVFEAMEKLPDLEPAETSDAFGQIIDALAPAAGE